MAASNKVIAGDYKGMLTFDKKHGMVIDEMDKVFKSTKHIVNKTTVDHIEVIDQDAKTSFASSVARGVVGAAVMGGVGAVAGAATGKKKKEYTVSIIFKDGSKALCDLDELHYNSLIKAIY